MQHKILWKIVVILISAALMGVATADDELSHWTATIALGY